MPRLMTTHQPSFGRVFLGSSHWVELEISVGVDFDVDHCLELENMLAPALRAPFVVLGHCRNAHTMQTDAMARSITLPGCAAVAVVLYPEGNAELCAALETMAKVQRTPFRVFQDRDPASAWLERHLRDARDVRAADGVEIELPDPLY